MMDPSQDRGSPTPRTLLEFLIRQREQTYVEIAADFVQTARRLGERGATLSARHLRRLASGERLSAMPLTRRVLREMFGRSAEELFGPYVAQPEPVTLPGQSHGLIAPPTSQLEEVLQMATQRAREFGILAGKVGVNAETIDQIYDDIRFLATAYQQRPLTEILGSLVDTQELVFSLLDHRTKPEQTRQLYFLAATVSGFLSKVSHDQSSPHAAMTHARTAYICADNAGHAGLKAWIRGLESLVSYWAGRPQDAIRYAQAGAEVASSSEGTAVVWLHANEARGWAALGNGNNALASIRRAQDSRDAVSPDELDEIGGLCTFNTPRQLYYAADALSWIPEQAPAAERYALDAIDAYGDESSPDWAFGDQAGSRADLAIARITSNELEGAIEAIAPVLQLPVQQRINGIVLSVQRLRQAAVSAGLTRANDLTEQIEIFTRLPVAALGQRQV